MIYTPPEKRRCVKSIKEGKNNVEDLRKNDYTTGNTKKDDNNDTRNAKSSRINMEDVADDIMGKDNTNGTGRDDDDDDALLLSQAMDNEDWVAPTQPDKSLFLSDALREGLLKQFDEIPYGGDVHMLTQEINRLRKQLGDSLGENQMLSYKVRNLNRENALLQDNLIRVQENFEQKFLEQKSHFERSERDMKSVIVYQEQDLRTKEFRDRLNNSTSVATENDLAEMATTSGIGRQNSPSVRVKKVSVPSFQSGSYFPRTLNDSPMLRKAFAHRKLVVNDTFRAIDSQERRYISNTVSDQNDSCDISEKGIRGTSSYQETQTLNPDMYNCMGYLLPDNRLSQFYGVYDEMISLGFRSVSSEMPSNRNWKLTRPMCDILAEQGKHWCR
uniref:Uncharacterized protein n=1 Tax=Setaria digitata TaxID=48799 RepID=A0A915PPI4_9BILA